MHELALAQEIIDLVMEQARAQAWSRVRRVRVQVGALAPVEAEALAFGFESAARDTLVEHAALELVRSEGRGRCIACGAEVSLARRGDGCSGCGSSQVLVTGGDELRVAELEVE